MRRPTTLTALTLGIAILATAPAVAARPMKGDESMRLVPKMYQPSARTARVAATSPCSALPGWECGSIEVPIARSNPALGTTEVSYAVRPHDDQSRPAEGTTLAVAGPGEATINEFGGFIFPFAALGDLTATRDLVLVDVRGTGAHALDCPDYQHGTGPFSEIIPRCAAQLGATADFYTYGDAADDLDDVRAALALERVDLYTAGHATFTIEAYAIRYPEHVRTLVLDSAADVPLWPAEDLRNAVDVVERICRRSPLCSAQIRDPKGDFAWLARRLRDRPLEGTGYDADGTPHQVRLGEAELAYNLLFDTSGPQRTLAELPAAARALRRGDPVPLLRLAAETDGSPVGAPVDDGDPAEFSTASLNAAFCAQWPFGWDKSAPRAQRLTQFAAARAALPRDFFAPFSIDAATAPLPDQCLEWPAPARTNPILPPGSSYPDVPVLVVTGDMNTNHPIRLARGVAARYPNARFVLVPQAAQSAAGTSACARRIIHSFVATLDPGDTRCGTDERAAFPGVGGFPRHVRGYAPATVDPDSRGDHSSRRDRSVAAAAVETYLDAVYTTLFRTRGTTGRGLRGGSYSVEFGDTGATFTLDHARLVEDVMVSGAAFLSFDPSVPDSARLTVGGAGTAAGVIEYSGEPVLDNTVSKIHVMGRIGRRALRLLVTIH